MNYVIRINVDNAAFGEDYGDAEAETARLLRMLEDALSRGHRMLGETTPLFDMNGNKVGFARLEE